MIQRFEDLIAWQKARVLARDVYEITRQGSLRRDFRMGDQIRSAAISVMSNIAEGFERGYRGEFHQFLTVAKGSCAEVRSLLYTAVDVQHIDPTTFGRLMPQAEEVARIIGGLRAAVERQRDG
jgi:four helix bundle protein